MSNIHSVNFSVEVKKGCEKPLLSLLQSSVVGTDIMKHALERGADTVTVEDMLDAIFFEENVSDDFITDVFEKIAPYLNERTGRKSKWTEIRCDFFDEEEKYWLVDAWKTGDDNEEGEVIAKISEAGEVVYLDVEAEYDEYAKEVVEKTIHNGGDLS